MSKQDIYIHINVKSMIDKLKIINNNKEDTAAQIASEVTDALLKAIKTVSETQESSSDRASLPSNTLEQL